MTKRKLTIVAVILSFIILILLLTGCADMGDFSSVTVIDGQEVECYDEYYALFDGEEAYLIGQDKTSIAYSVEDCLFNSNIVDELRPLNPEDFIPQEEYLYFSVKFDKGLTIDEFALYFLTEDITSLDLYVYIMTDDEYNDVMTKVRAYNDPFYEQKEDGSGNLLFEDAEHLIPVFDTDRPIAYTDPDKEDAIYHSLMGLGGSEDCLYIQTFQVGGEEKETIKVEEGDRFLIYFRSNSGYGKDDEFSLVQFGVINMLFCVRDIGE